MPEETTAIDYVMEAASGPHFSGLRLDGLRSAASSPRASAPLTSAFSFSTVSDSAAHKQPFVIGVSGGTASGKTTVCDMIIQQLHDHRVVLVNQYNFSMNHNSFQYVEICFYRGLTPEELKHVHEYNFDHPDAFDTEQLLECVETLRSGDNHVAIDLIVQHIRTKLGQHDLCKIYPNVYVIQSTFQIRGMHTLIRDRDISKHDFVFYSDRLIRLVVEHGLGHLPFTEKQIVTPTGSVYTGVDFCKKLCGVSIVRSGESMENALRACCKGIKIGKILIHRDGDNGKQLIYEKLPKDICERHVLLLDPVLATGNSANQAIELLIQKGVPESHIIFLNLISAPEGIHCVSKRFPSLKIVTSEIDVALNEEFRVIPGMGEFGDRYFGTDD
ncbi:UNVERIFIED_CONTAM: Uridine kinase-like protein 2, chloroplastic [Sesamum radiatum]|uniref:Uridine kinase-like protein 2, chloroplastic n=1 Tax=Sesamum radiatum TaxID=300843 RepID=A0AAW2P8I5_SESRA